MATASDNRTMHLLVPFASDTSEACRQVLGDLQLPHLSRLLTELSCTGRDDAAADTFSPPHERALAAIRGWQGSDGAWPFAAQAAFTDGVDVGEQPWGLLTPAHWQLGRDRIVMLDPAALQLDEDESRTLFDALRGLFESDGFTTAWGAADRWYVGHAGLEGVATASVDRVVGRNVDDWLGAAPAQRAASRHAAGPQGRSAAGSSHMPSTLRRLQSEAQIVLYTHPVNEARESRGVLPVNSFWLSGCGRLQPGGDAAAPTVDASLRPALMATDWAAWADAWRAIDATTLSGLRASLNTADTRNDAPLTITLCGERGAVRYERRPQSLLQRLRGSWQTVQPNSVLQTL